MYQVLRRLSAWTVGGWYSEVYVDGAENVSKTGPLILAATHHNEIIDIATLSVTIPHERPICFWAKSTMFKHPVSKFIMESSGAIRVKRNPNRVGSSSGSSSSTEEPNTGPTSSNETPAPAPTSKDHASNGSPPTSPPASTQGDLFNDTSRALAEGEVIGVFPEGTSYTLPSIAQVLPGAAWAAVEYVRSVRKEKLEGMKSERERLIYLNGVGRRGEKTGLEIVPVGIVYEDKKRFMSRIHVGFGEPIEMDDYTKELFDESLDPEEAAKSVVKKLNAEIERRLFGLTVNAPDWETLYAARTAMKILWADEAKVQMETWVKVLQSLIRHLSAEPSAKLEPARKALTRYHSLLYYTGIDHAILEEVLPISPTSANLTFSLVMDTFSNLTSGLPFALIRFAAFFPAMLFHIPGYVLSQVAVRALKTPGEEETEAQYRGLGHVLGIGLSALWLIGKFRSWGIGFSLFGLLVLGIMVYSAMYTLVQWHLILVRGNLRELRRWIVFGKLALAVLFPVKLTSRQLQVYSTPPAPPVNPFVKKENNMDINNNRRSTSRRPPQISPHKLVQELLDARMQAHISLGNYMRNSDSKETTFLLSQGGRVPFVVS